MQAMMIPFALTLSLTSAVQLSLLPYAYLADPLPVYHQSQDTRTGQHAYSYSGGPSAKEEVRGLDGITRGSYSYVDANGHLQSTFYVADEHGFRVAATNLPTDEDLPVDPAVELAKRFHFEELAKAASSSRKRRSVETISSAEYKYREGQKNVEERRMIQFPETQDKQEKLNSNEENHAEATRTSVYGNLGSVFIRNLSTTATSQEDQVKEEPVDSAVLIESQPTAVVVESQPLTSTFLLSSQVPLATSHQSRVQVHRNFRVEPLESENGSKAWDESLSEVKIVTKPESHLSVVPTIEKPEYRIETIPVINEISSSLQDRVELHRNLGLEGPDQKDAIKIKTTPVAVVQPSLPPLSVVAEETLPVVQPISNLPVVATAISSQSRTQIHGSSKIEISPAIEPAIPLETIPILSVPVLRTLPTVLHSLPVATSSQSRSQVHSSRKLQTINPIYTL